MNVVEERDGRMSKSALNKLSKYICLIIIAGLSLLSSSLDWAGNDAVCHVVDF